MNPDSRSRNFRAFSPPVKRWLIRDREVVEEFIDGVSPQWVWITARRGGPKYKIMNPGTYESWAEAAISLLDHMRNQAEFHEQELGDLRPRIRALEHALSDITNYQ